MISWLQGIFDSISNFFGMITDTINSIIDKMIEFFGYIGSAVDFVKGILNFLPSFYLVFAGIVLVVLVIYLILGRQSGGD